MTPPPALACPSCKRTFAALEWTGAEHCRCRSCLGEFIFAGFPALEQKQQAVKPQAVVVADDSTCFFHAENQAEKLCDECGRFLCAVCAVPMSGRTICPTCISASRAPGQILKTTRTLHGMAALLIVCATMLPMFWWFTVLTAPFAIGLALYGWKKPQSLVAPRRWPAVVAIVLAALQLGGWGFLLLQIALK